MRDFRVFAGVLCVCAAPALAQDQDGMPLSAIDWLSESVAQPEVTAAAPRPGTQANRIPDADEAPISDSATTPDVSVQVLGGPAPRALGLLTPASTGFPVDLWQNSDAAILAALFSAEDIDTLPAVQNLLTTLAIVAANPPRGGANGSEFFLARVDKLLAFGALEPAQALLEAAGPDSGALFQRWFDVSLLTGTETRACRDLVSRPAVSPTPAAQIFCLARSGDWFAAALTLNTGRSLGDIAGADADLLARFLDPDLFEDEPPLPTPARVTPLTFRMFEAIGAPLATEGLPRAFAHADLRANVGWKAQLEAAERLARAGAIAPNVLSALYLARTPAASGGVWARSKAVARLKTALAGGDPAIMDQAIETLWEEVQGIGVAVPLAEIFAPDLLQAEVGSSHATLFQLLLLSPAYEEAALVPALAATDPFLAAVARGDPSDARPVRAGQSLIKAAFAAPPEETLVEMAQEGRSGEAILRTIATLQQGIDGDERAFRDGIATLRALGLEDAARRTSLQYLLLR